ncbi:MAG: hypothetical protein ACF8PG_01455 [Maioricimonas sp. JB045]
MNSEEAKRLRELEDGNRRLKRIVEDLQRQEHQSGAVVITRPARKTVDQS